MSGMLRLTFRDKLVIAMVAMLIGVSGAILWRTQVLAERSYRSILEDQFREGVASFAAKRELRLETVQASVEDATRNVRLVAALRAGATERFQSDLEFELRALLMRFADPSGSDPDVVPFFRFLDENGDLLAVPGEVAGEVAGDVPGVEPERMGERLKRLRLDEARREGKARIGYLSFEVGAQARLYEIIVVRMVDRYEDPENNFLGDLVFAIPWEGEGTSASAAYWGGLMVDGELWGHFPDVSASDINGGDSDAQGSGVPAVLRDRSSGSAYWMLRSPLVVDARFPEAFQVMFLPMDNLNRLLADLRGSVGFLALLAVIIGGSCSLWLRRRLTGRIDALVRATKEVGLGRLDTRVEERGGDEIAVLGKSFNEMTAGLALKEKYRSILDLVSDPEVATRLLEGEVSPGGEERHASILFCDIRGFTAMTDAMPPREVIAMVNEHMTALTAVVYQYGGVVDKFIGDEIMVLFGVPRSGESDTENAVKCGLRMIEERGRLNGSSGWKLEIGIGIATGQVVAGCMGSSDRLNYSVLGKHVNLAARLCGAASPMELVVCSGTLGAVDGGFVSRPKPELRLKGFPESMAAHTVLRARDV